MTLEKPRALIVACKLLANVQQDISGIRTEPHISGTKEISAQGYPSQEATFWDLNPH